VNPQSAIGNPQSKGGMIMAKDKDQPDLKAYRNIGIIAHIDAGKTTTTEHILYYAGVTHRLGEVDSGNTQTDYDEEEQERGITIYSACIPFPWQGCTVNLIDTPGHVDFTAEVERSLRVLDGCVVIFDAQKGVEAQSETVWRQADRYEVPRLVFINKMDVVGANFANVLAQIRQRLLGNPVPLTIPIGSGSPKDSTTPFRGIVDLLSGQALFYEASTEGKTFRAEPVPEEMRQQAQRWRDNLFDRLTEHDEEDQITSAYLEGKEIPVEVIREVIRQQTLRRQIQPVFCGSGREHIGIQPLMDGVAWYLPTPLDRPPVPGFNPKKKGHREVRPPDPSAPFSGLVFKIVADRHNELFFVRIYSGVLKQQSRLYNATRDCKELISKVYHTDANPHARKETPQAYAGDIVALLGLKESITGDTLCDSQHPIVLEKIQFAQAVVSRSIEPQSSDDKDKVLAVLDLLRKEDPTFHVRVDPDTGQTLMSGMGMLHLDIKQHRMERDFKLKVRVGKPRVSYRETLRNPIRVEGTCIRQTGGAGLFAKIEVAFEPHTPARVDSGEPPHGPSHGEEPVVVEVDLPEDLLSPQLVVAAEQGIRGALESGELGYPVMNVKATLVGGEMSEEMSNEMAFQAAGADAVRKALHENIVLLEPWMKLNVVVPEEYLGPVNSDLNARRAEIHKLENNNRICFVEALVPLSSMFDYADKMRSLSQGRASSTMEPHRYLPAPDDVLHSLLHPEDYY
jgi:elongation factor G